MLSNMRVLFEQPIVFFIYNMTFLTVSNRLGDALYKGLFELSLPMMYLVIAIYSFVYFITLKVFACEFIPTSVMKTLSYGILIVGWSALFFN